MDVTESELAWALRTVKIMVHDKDGLSDLAGCFPGGTLVTRGKGAVWLPEEHAAMLLKKIADDQKRRRGEEAQCRAEGARCDREGGPCTCPCDPEAEAAALREPEPVAAGELRAADPELSAIAAIIAALDGIDDGESAGQPHGPFWRVLAYLAARYGYVLADTATGDGEQ